MYYMFHMATNFNQDLGNWNVSNVTYEWNVPWTLSYNVPFNQDMMSLV